MTVVIKFTTDGRTLDGREFRALQHLRRIAKEHGIEIRVNVDHYGLSIEQLDQEEKLGGLRTPAPIWDILINIGGFMGAAVAFWDASVKLREYFSKRFQVKVEITAPGSKVMFEGPNALEDAEGYLRRRKRQPTN